MLDTLEMTSTAIPTVVRVEKIRKETYDTVTLVLKGSQSGEFKFTPGQFNMVYTFGIGEIPVSISGDASDSKNLVHTIRAVGGVTTALLKMKKSEVLGIRGPFGKGWPIDQAKGRDLLIVAGGIGLAPIRPVIYEALARRKKFGRIIVLYGTRTPEDILFRKEVEKWRGRLDMEVLVTVDRSTGAWKGHVGVVTTLLKRVSINPENTVAMICGPEIMMRYSVQELMEIGMNPKNVFLSMERNMQCGFGLCGHCQWGPFFVCKDGPVFCYEDIQSWLTRREL